MSCNRRFWVTLAALLASPIAFANYSMQMQMQSAALALPNLHVAAKGDRPVHLASINTAFALGGLRGRVAYVGGDLVGNGRTGLMAVGINRPASWVNPRVVGSMAPDADLDRVPRHLLPYITMQQSRWAP